jgi:uncharacterized membrane protein
MVGVARLAAEAVAENSVWMAWNLMLALVPLVLAVHLFREPRRRTTGWWLGLLAFVAFLPNAPYVLTDVIHLIGDTRDSSSSVVVSTAVMAEYAVFFLVGFEAYVGALLLLGRYLVRAGRGRWVVPVEVGLHAVCAVGIHLGRFDRLNSWDLVARPELLPRGVAGLDPVLVVAAFVAVATAYVVMKRVTLALVAYRPGRAEGLPVQVF